MPLFYSHAIPKHLPAQLIEAPVVMVPHIPQGLARLLANFRKGKTIEEVQAQGFTLVLREGLEHLG